MGLLAQFLVHPKKHQNDSMFYREKPKYPLPGPHPASRSSTPPGFLKFFLPGVYSLGSHLLNGTNASTKTRVKNIKCGTRKIAKYLGLRYQHKFFFAFGVQHLCFLGSNEKLHIVSRVSEVFVI